MKLLTNPNFIAILFLIILTIPAVKSLAIPGFYSSHDGIDNHTVRIAQYTKAIIDGQFPPRHANSLYKGLGSPIFVYIYPVPYVFGAVLHLLDLSYVNSFKVIMALGFFFSGLLFYLWTKEIFKSEKAAFTGAIFYTWIPYRFSLIYVRGSLSELIAYTFLPLLLFTITKFFTGKNVKWLPAIALSFSLVLLSQNLVALIAIPIIGAYILILSFLNKSFKNFFLSLCSLFWGFLISSFTYLPSLFERQYVRFDETFRNTYLDHLVTIKQLIRSPWDYGFDLKGTVSDQMSFQIGLAHLLIVFLSTLLIIYSLFLKREKPRRESLEIIFPLFFLLVFVILVLLMIQTNLTLVIWHNLKILQIIDLPWRLLGIVALSTAFLAAFVAKKLKPGLLFLLLVSAVLTANRNHLRINQTIIKDDSYFETYTGTATQYNEFTPIWRQSTREPVGFSLNTKAEISSGEGNINDAFSKSNHLKFDVAITSPRAQLTINKFYFPKTQVTVDGKNLSQQEIIITNTTNTRLDIERDTSGLVALNLEKGNHTVEFRYKETPLRVFANFLSLISLLLALGFIVKNVKK